MINALIPAKNRCPDRELIFIDSRNKDLITSLYPTFFPFEAFIMKPCTQLPRFPLILSCALLAGCATFETAAPYPEDTELSEPEEPEARYFLSEAETEICENLGLDPEEIARLEAKPLYDFDEQQVDAYLRYLQERRPDLRDRVVHLARKNIGQPYQLHLLGELPFETHDPLPLYDLSHGDCVVFIEHIYAMALGRDWPTFFALLQRLRYDGGRIGVATRNHYTEADWNRNNAWLVEDITDGIGGDEVTAFTQRVDRAGFLKNRYEIERDIPVEEIEETFLPFEQIEQAKPHLKDGDFVNVVTGRDGGYWVSHVGMIGLGDDGEVRFIHSTRPEAREEPIDRYIERRSRDIEERDAEGNARFHGFKFLRLREDALDHLRRIDGRDAPRVVPPAESKLDDPYQPVLAGLDVLLEDGGPLKEKKAGLITNPTGITRDGRQNIDALSAAPDVELAALFAPEHGVRGQYYAGERVGTHEDEATGLPVYSLYGETRRPESEWLEGLDALVYDIQDTGNRSYTYIYTMAYAMEAARDAGIPFFVLDRPDPFGGTLVDGNILDPEKGTSFVGLYPIAYLYGMTPGELARYFNTEFEIGCDLRVIEMKGWRRSATFEETGLKWVLPSQHVPRPETAYHMAATGTIGELHTVSVGIGFTLPFEVVGAPWIDSGEFARELRARELPGVEFRPLVLVPRYGTYEGESCHGVQIHITDSSRMRPVSLGIHIMDTLQSMYQDEHPLGDSQDETARGRIRMFNRVMGTDEVRNALLEGAGADEIIESWQADVNAFLETRERYLLY